MAGWLDDLDTQLAVKVSDVTSGVSMNGSSFRVKG